MKMQENHQIILNFNRKEYETFLKFFGLRGHERGGLPEVWYSTKQAEIFNDIAKMILDLGENNGT